MKVCLYLEAENVVARSGFRTAFAQHLRALERLGVPVTTDPTDSFDILHVHWFGPRSLYYLKRAKQQGKIVIAHAHSIGTYDFKDSFTLSNTFAPLYERYLHYFYELSDAIFTPSGHAKRLLQAQGISRPIYVVSNGVDLEKFKFDAQAREKYRQRFGLKRFTVFSAGNIIPRKGVLDFLEVARRLPQFDFIWFGQAWGRLLAFDSEMHRALDERPANVKLPGFIEDAPGAFSAGDLLFYPSYGETHGLVLLEAAALQRPLVMRALPEYTAAGWRDGENCLTEKTIDGFCEKIVMLAHDTALRERLAGAAYRLAEANSLDRVGHHLYQLYQALLAIARKGG
ncbi:MAG: glycosyltransferase family 4 protein [Candidatus Bipolaricaulota bacterium]|nr:glycosyltransferase family 4 protein [Candidatus Bipolaricaulota bacterium]